MLELQPLEYVGGHGGILRAGGRVYKPFQGGERGVREAAFYARVSTAAAGVGAGAEAPPACFMPRYHGTATLAAAAAAAGAEGGVFRVVVPGAAAGGGGVGGSSGGGALEGGEAQAQYLVLEDLTAPMALPCVADIKVGTQTYTPDTDAEKAAREREKYPWQASLGFRVTGMHVREPRGGGTRCYWRSYGLGLDPFTALHAFEAFLFDGAVVRRDVAVALLLKLRPIAEWFAAQTDAVFYSSSVLLLYDGGVPIGCPPVVDVRMVDFAHVWDARGCRDEGVLCGLREIISRLEEVAAGSGPPANYAVPPTALTRREENVLAGMLHAEPEGEAVRTGARAGVE